MTNQEGIQKAMIDQKLVVSFADAREIEHITAEKVLWLTRVMHNIATSSIAGDFALMGGSAIVYLHKYSDLYRYSTDIDLDFVGDPQLGKKDTREVSKRRKQDIAVLAKIAGDLGMSFRALDEGENVGRLWHYQMEYRSIYGKRDSVDIDLSYLYSYSTMPTELLRWPISQEAGVDEFKVQALSREELYAAKTIVLIGGDRKNFKKGFGLGFKNPIRSLYDVYMLANDLKQNPRWLNQETYRNLCILFGMNRITNFQFFRGDVIGTMNEDDVPSKLRGVLPHTRKLPALDEMQRVVRRFVDDHVFTWGDKEWRIAESFARNIFHPEELFGHGEISERLGQMFYFDVRLERVRGQGRKKTRSRKAAPKKR